jgi:hypothetical protein
MGQAAHWKASGKQQLGVGAGAAIGGRVRGREDIGWTQRLEKRWMGMWGERAVEAWR